MERRASHRNGKWFAILVAALLLPLFAAPFLAEWFAWRINSAITRLMLVFGVLAILGWLGLPKPKQLWRSLGDAPIRTIGKALGITLLACVGYSTLLIATGTETLRTWEQFKNPDRLILGLLTGLVVSFIEEPIFRRLLLRKLSIGGSVAVGAVLSSFLYALIHYVRPDKVPRQETYSIGDAWAVYVDILGNLVEPFRNPAPGLGLFLLGLLLCAVVVRKGLAWTIGIHAGLVYYVKADSCFLFWNLNEKVRDRLYGTFERMYDGWMFCVVCGIVLLAVVSRSAPAGPDPRSPRPPR